MFPKCTGGMWGWLREPHPCDLAAGPDARASHENLHPRPAGALSMSAKRHLKHVELLKYFDLKGHRSSTCSKIFGGEGRKVIKQCDIIVTFRKSEEKLLCMFLTSEITSK